MTAAVATVAGVGRDIEPLTGLATCVLATAESTGVTDDPPPQAAIANSASAVTERRRDSVFDGRVVEGVGIRFPTVNPSRDVSTGRILDQARTTFDVSEI